MKKILQSIVLILLSLTQVYSQQDTIPKSDSTRIVQDQKGNGNRSTNGNYINMDLPGIDLIGADFKPLDDTIAKLNLAGWDVKVIGFYGLSGSMDRTVYDQLITNIETNKQAIITILGDNSSGKRVKVSLKNNSENQGVISLIALEIENGINSKLISFESDKVINHIAKEISRLLYPIPVNGFLPSGMNSRNADDETRNMPYFISVGNHFLTPSNVIVFLPTGTKVWFFNGNWTCLGHEGFAKGMLYAFEIDGRIFRAYGELGLNDKLNLNGYYTDYGNVKSTIYKPLKETITPIGMEKEIKCGFKSDCGLVIKHLIVRAGAEDLSGLCKGPAISLNDVLRIFFKIRKIKLNKSYESDVNHSIDYFWEDFTMADYEKNDCPPDQNFITENKFFLQYQARMGGVVKYEKNMIVLYSDEGIIFYKQDDHAAYFYDYTFKQFVTFDTPEEAETRWNNAIKKKIAEEVFRSAIIIVPAAIGMPAGLFVTSLVEGGLIGSLYIINGSEGEALINVLCLVAGVGLVKSMEKTMQTMDDVAEAALKNERATLLNHLSAEAKEARAAYAEAGKPIASETKLAVSIKIDGVPKHNFDYADFVKQSGMTLDECRIFHNDLEQLYKSNNNSLPIKFFEARMVNGKLEFDYVKAWEKLINTGLRTNINWLETTSKWIDDGLELTSTATKVTIKKAGVEVGEISGDLLKVKYPHYGGDVVCHQSKTTTLVGKFNDEVNQGGISVVKNSQLYKYGENPAGVNILNDPNWTWDINSQWLTSAANRGDIIRVVSDPTNVNNIWIDGIVNGTRSTYGKEVKLLEDLGYSFNPSKYEFVK